MRRLCSTAALCGWLAFGATSAAAATSTIGVYFDSQATDCDATIPPMTEFTVYIIVLLGDDALQAGMTGAEFRVDGFDPNWFTTHVTRSPASNVAIGNPIAGGCNIAFPQCQTGGPVRDVLLYTIGQVALTPISPRTFEVLPHSTPSSPNFVCPLLTNCSAPVFSKFCVEGRNACVNRDVSCCIVATTPATWSGVKALYATER